MRFPALGLVICLLALGLDLRAQSTNASVTGEVTDASKALIVGTKVVAVSKNTGAEYETESGTSGFYRLANLPPGTYDVKIEKSGFKTLVKSDLVLHVQDALNIDIEMEVGSASETIRVESGGPQLNTESATVSTLVDNRFVADLPLNGRSFSSLLDLTPGVVLSPTAAFYEQGQFSVNGQRPDANYFMVDGVSGNLGTPGTGFGQEGPVSFPSPMPSAA